LSAGCACQQRTHRSDLAGPQNATKFDDLCSEIATVPHDLDLYGSDVDTRAMDQFARIVWTMISPTAEHTGNAPPQNFSAGARCGCRRCAPCHCAENYVTRYELEVC
jgi:hypothetical protein